MESDAANVNHTIRLEISEDVVIVEIDGLRGEVRDGQAREVREALAHTAVQLIQQTTRARRAEAEMLSSGSAIGGAVNGRFNDIERLAHQVESRRRWGGL